MSKEEKDIIEDRELAVAVEEKEIEVVDEGLLKGMVEAGLAYGRTKNKTHPKMKPFVLANRNGVEILNLEKGMPSFDKALVVLGSLIAEQKKIILVATQPAAREIVRDLAKEFGMPYVVDKWVGGALTNFDIIRKRIAYFTKLKNEAESGKLAKYTKKEQAGINRELEKMRFLFSGIEEMSERPAAMLVINPKMHMTAVREAKRIGIPVAALLSSDGDVEGVEYPIIGNDNSKSAIAFMLNKIREVFKSSLSKEIK